MLNTVSWEDYIETLLVLLAIFYSLLTLYWFGPQLRAWWRRQQRL
jgi:uncharacterized BrkB/YihY/UPF0761 family membrane protein